MYDFDFIIALLIIAPVIFYIMHSVRLKEFANKVAAQHCASLEVQFLDQTVFLQKMRIARSTSGRLGIERHYHFEFTTTGEDRYRGEVILMGFKVLSVFLAPHKLH